MNPTTRKALKSAATHLAAAVFAVIVAVATFFSDDPEQTVRGLCARQDLVALSGSSELCTHGPDPKPALRPTAEAGIRPVTPTALCRDQGPGPRVHLYLTYPTDRPPADMAAARAAVIRTAGYTQRQMDLSSGTYRQGFRWFCEQGVPVVSPHPVTDLADLDDAIAALPGEGPHGEIALFMAQNASFPYCGVGTIMGEEGSKAQGNDGLQYESRQWSLIDPDCQGTGGTTLHELMHNLGAVQPSAPHAGGHGWHGYQDQDVMSYNDGSEWFTCTAPFNVSGCGATVRTCGSAPAWFLDCGKDDYWNPRRPTTGTWATRWNTADSPFLSVPVRK